jgi:hypothetical protein
MPTGAHGRIEELVDGRRCDRRRDLMRRRARNDGQDGGKASLVDVIGKLVVGIFPPCEARRTLIENTIFLKVRRLARFSFATGRRAAALPA